MDATAEQREHIPSFFISAGTGINNNTGLFGLSFEKTFGKKNLASWTTGIGMSAWGIKACAEAKYYFHTYEEGWAIAGGFTFNTGYGNYETNMYLAYPGTGSNGHPYERVSLTLLPQTSGYVACYYHCPLGNRIRFFGQFGWSMCFTQEKVSVAGGHSVHKLSSEYSNLILFYAPGGPIFAGGLSFAVRKKTRSN